jgi:hypothetical protein
MTVDNVDALHGAVSAKFEPVHSVMLISVAREFQARIADSHLYEATRTWWRVQQRQRQLGSPSAPAGRWPHIEVSAELSTGSADGRPRRPTMTTRNKLAAGTSGVPAIRDGGPPRARRRDRLVASGSTIADSLHQLRIATCVTRCDHRRSLARNCRRPPRVPMPLRLPSLRCHAQ